MDLISRKAAIDAVEDIDCSDGVGISALKCEAVDDVVTAIKVLPSAQPEQSIAEWQKDFREYINMLNIQRDDYKGIMEYINDVPSAQPEPQWIPCSEMEPKKSGRYLCTHSGTWIVSPDYYTTQEQAEELFADPEDEYLDLEEYIGWTSKNVIAWMPLPTAYREDGGE